VKSLWEAEEEESDHHNGSILLQAAITVGDFQLAGLLIECGVVGDFKALDAVIDKQSFQLFHHLLEAQLLNPGPPMKTGKHLDKSYPHAQRSSACFSQDPSRRKKNPLPIALDRVRITHLIIMQIILFGQLT